ncbi:MAG: TrlF family AAA-like ATPase [Candidatus Methanoperedens sp.]|nr:PHP domain-containing protein [Candidatus Methanoperedens sp.]MCZ7394706.1 PHP domain-containing protein [Candidatus Methanoperedens sp.]
MEDIETLDNGAKFYKCDLHIHTPASYDFTEKTITPKDIIETAIKKGLKVIAITDHNTSKWCKDLIEAAKGTELCILPGVEITCSDGIKNIHLIALFPKDKSKRIQDLLSKIKINVEEQENPTGETHSEYNVVNVLNVIKELGGFAIAPHADSVNGIASGKEGIPRVDIIKHPALMSVETKNEKTKKCLDGSDSVYNRKLACIRSSDNHSLDGIGSESTFIKLDMLDFEGLRQAFLDPDSRIREVEESIEYPLIIGMIFEGGFLDGHVLHFNKNLNCLIGSRGTGKSTIIELLRYALNDSPDEMLQKVETQRQGLIKYTLGDGGKVTVFIKTSAGQVYQIERAFDDETKILDDKGNQIQVSVNDLFKIEAYSQEEVVEIAKKPSIQLDMIDSHADIKDLVTEKETIKKKLKKNAKELGEEIAQVDEWSTEVAQLGIINHQLMVLDEHGLKDRLKIQRIWENDKRIIQKIREEIEKEIKRCDDWCSIDSVEVPVASDEFANPKVIELCRNALIEAKQKQMALKKEELKIWQTTKINFEKFLMEWNKNYTNQKEAYRELLKQLQKEGIQEPSNYLKLEDRKKDLELLANRVEEKRKSIKKYERERNKLLEELSRNSKNIFGKRQEIAEEITEKTNNFVQVKIEHEKDRELYENFVMEMLNGSGIRDTKSNPNKQRIALIHPIDLVKFVRNGQIEELAKQASVAKNIAEKAIYHFKNKEIFDLELQDLNDRPEIKLKLEDGTYKPITKLSPGQKCTAILSIAMLKKDKPLIVDQPEDAIDNSFIRQQIVEGLRAIKNKRQIILATHNANIPVLGDAELIMVMKAEENKGEIVCCGAIDRQAIKDYVTSLLEGGKEAFTMRLEKYGF